MEGGGAVRRGGEEEMSPWPCMARWGKQGPQEERKGWGRDKETCHHLVTKSKMRGQIENIY